MISIWISNQIKKSYQDTIGNQVFLMFMYIAGRYRKEVISLAGDYNIRVTQDVNAGISDPFYA